MITGCKQAAEAVAEYVTSGKVMYLDENYDDTVYITDQVKIVLLSRREHIEEKLMIFHGLIQAAIEVIATEVLNPMQKVEVGADDFFEACQVKDTAENILALLGVSLHEVQRIANVRLED